MVFSQSRRTRLGGVRIWSAMLFVILFSVFLFSPSIEAADVTLAWDPSESTVAGYKVYVGTSSRNYSSSTDVGNNTQYTLSGLEDGKTYYIATTAYDSAGTESDYSNEITNDGTPVPAASSASPESGSGGGCFIATAAYGSYLAPQVRILRDFRDHFLMTNSPGRSFVKFYYAVSPPIADFIGRHEVLRSMTRWSLTPVVYLIQYAKIVLVIAITAILCPLMYSRIVKVQRRRRTA